MLFRLSRDTINVTRGTHCTSKLFVQCQRQGYGDTKGRRLARVPYIRCVESSIFRYSGTAVYRNVRHDSQQAVVGHRLSVSTPCLLLVYSWSTPFPPSRSLPCFSAHGVRRSPGSSTFICGSLMCPRRISCALGEPSPCPAVSLTL